MVSFDGTERIVAFGAGEVLVDAVAYAHKLGFETAVVTSPRQDGAVVRGELMTDRLNAIGVETHVTEDVSGDEQVAEMIDGPTLGLSFGAAWIFSESFIEALDSALVNFHGSRLPQDRGGGGFSWRILRDDPMGYSQAHLITPGIDTGDLLLSKEYRFSDSCTTPEDYAAFAAEREIDLVTEFLDGVKSGREFDVTGQPEYLSSYWPRLSTSEHGYIDWDWSLDDIVQFVRAFSDPYEGAKTFVNGTEVRIKGCESYCGDGTFHPFQTGIVYRKSADCVYVATPDGTLVVDELLNEDGDSVRPDIAVGDRLYTPDERLERARRTRVYFTPTGMRREQH